MNLSKTKRIIVCAIAVAICIATAAYLWIYNGIYFLNEDEILQTVSEYQMFEMTEGAELSLSFAAEHNYVQSVSLLLINLESEEPGNLKLSIADKTGATVFENEIPLSDIPAGEFYEASVYTKVSKNADYSIKISQTGASMAPYLLYADEAQVANGADSLVAVKYGNEASNWEKFGIMLSVVAGLLVILLFCFEVDVTKYSQKIWTKVALGALLLIQFIMMMPTFRYDLDKIGLDQSWRYVLNIYGYRGYKFGDDAFFTYGPLGFICYLMNLDNNGITYYVGLAILIVVVAINAYFLVKAFTLVVQNKLSSIAVALAALVYILNYTKPEWDNYMLYTLILGVVVSLKERKESAGRRDWNHIVTIIAINFLFVVMSLSKFSTFTSALSFTILFAIFDYFFNKRIESLTYFAPACVVSVVSYLIYNPSVSDLLRYLRGIFAISDGWMISSQWDDCFTPSEWRKLITIMVMFVILMVTAIICDYKSSHVIISLSSSMFLLFKYASTRHGIKCGLWLYAMLFSVAVLSFNWDVLFARKNIGNMNVTAKNDNSVKNKMGGGTHRRHAGSHLRFVHICFADK